MEKKANVTLGSQNYRTTVMVEGHEVIVDEPVAMGGGNEGPSSTHLLLSSLGACAAVTMRMYAERKEWMLGDISIDMKIEQENKNGIMYSEISRNISFSEALSPEQRKRLLVIADKCPIHKTLLGHVNIETE